MVKAKNLTFQYNGSDDLFRFPDIKLSDEESLLILGKSGIGKTTLLHLISGLLQPKSGSITIDNVSLQILKNKELDQFVGKHIGLVFQKNYANRSLNVLENLQARLYFSKQKTDKLHIENLLRTLNIIDCKNKKINELSEGQLQRLGIALSVVHQPKIILADEPTASLDDDNCKIVLQLLFQQAKVNKANLIVITHDQRVKPMFKNVLEL